MDDQLYSYLGPRDLLDAVGRGGAPRDTTIEALDEAEEFLVPEDGWATFVITETGCLRIGPRRTEHVALAEGQPVRSAGEIRLVRDRHLWRATELTNQSTGYCPQTSSWPAVAQVLDSIGVEHPESWTAEFTFVWCTNCRQLNVITDSYMACRNCGTDLEAPSHPPNPNR